MTHMKKCRNLLGLILLTLVLVWRTQAGAAIQTALDGWQTNRAVTTEYSLILDAVERNRAVSTFLNLVQIKGISGREQAIRDEVKRLLMPLEATELFSNPSNSKAPLNLVMEIPATGALTNQPGILLNAHLDTISQSTPEETAFDAATADFFH